MGLLAPLYALAALAVAGPILFHLIRRQPKGQAQFSSLMFLKPSPPQLTRRSRVDDWLLLLLRALVLVLLAVAFARPFFRQFMTTAAELANRRVVIAIDTSASMTRSAVWSEAIATAREAISELGENDQLCLYTIDSGAVPVISIESSDLSTVDSQTSGLEDIESLEPTWLAGDLAEGIRSIADELVSVSIQGNDAPSVSDSIILISDLHQGCGIDGLQGYDWPERVTLDIRQVDSAESNNASIEILPPLANKPGALRVRVDNCEESATSVFTVGLEDSAGNRTAESQIQLPPGRTRVVSLGRPPETAVRVALDGDGWDADNTQSIVARRKRTEEILFLSSPQPAEPASRLDYFLSKAPLNTSDTVRTVVTLQTDNTSPAEFAMRMLQEPASVIVDPVQVPEEYFGPIKEYLQSGGNVLVCLSSYRGDMGQVGRLVGDLLLDESVGISVGQVDDFALIERVDYSHPVFTPFADPRFNDFSKIRIWEYQSVEWDGLARAKMGAESLDSDGRTEGSSRQSLRVIASLEGGEPLLAVKSIPGKESSNSPGTVWLLTTGWQTSNSSLALSSKFVPILQGILNRPTNQPRNQTVEVGESFEATDEMQIAYLGTVDGQALRADGEDTQLLLPGNYKVSTPDEQWSITAIVPRKERNHAPADGDAVEAFGVTTGEVASAEELLAEAEQLKIEQLEQRQKVWQWLIAAGVLLLAVESLLTLRKSPAKQQPAA